MTEDPSARWQQVQEPVVSKRIRAGRDDETSETHPCYGQIGASRVSGGALLFGSDFQHQHFVTIAIHESILNRTLSHDWSFPRRELIEVMLSEAQWAHFVSALNTGDMAQCTIRHVDGEPRPGLVAPPSRTEQFKSEVDEDLQRAMSALKELEQQIDELKLSGKATTRLQGYVSTARRALDDSVPFVAKSFAKHVEITKERARIEINAHITNSIQRAGLKALGADTTLPLELKP